MNSLSRREKMLLYIMALLIILVGGLYFLVLPAFEHYQSARATLAETELRKREADAAISSMEPVSARIDELRAQYAGLQQQLHPLLENEEFDKMITDMLLENGLLPVSLTVNSAGYLPLPEYGVVLDEEDEEAAAAYPSLPANTLRLEAVGKDDAIMAFIDDIAASDHLWLSYGLLESSAEAAERLQLMAADDWLFTAEITIYFLAEEPAVLDLSSVD